MFRRDFVRRRAQSLHPIAAAALIITCAAPEVQANTTSFFDSYATHVSAGVNISPLSAAVQVQTLSRVAPVEYADGVGALVDRPSPRDISNAISQPQTGKAHARPLSNLAVEMLQLLASHEIARSPTGTEKIDIPVAADDPVAVPGAPSPVMSQDRSLFTGTPRDQLNDVTHIFDGSTVYGSDLTTQALLRTNDGSGQLKTGPDGGLPIINGRRKAGDVRADENPGLQAVHALFLKEHNRVAQKIESACVAQQLSCSGDDIFEGARQVVAATQEKIFYEELLPLFLNTDDLTSLLPDPTVLNRVEGAINEFTAAAGRIGHTMVPDTIRLQLPGGTAREVDLNGCFFNADCLGGASLDEQLFGLAQQKAEAVDTMVVDTLRNAQVPGFGATILIDLLAANINRGRDHGLPSYMDLRAALGFPDVPIETLLPQFILDAFPDYASGGIDAIVGVFAEDRPMGQYMGDTGRALWALQFLKIAEDSPFGGPNPLLDSYLSGVSMAGLIANNTGLTRSQLGNPFLASVPLPGGGVLMLSGLALFLARRRRV